MGYDRGDSFPFDFKPNGIPFSSKSKGKLSPPSYPIQCERKWKYSFLSKLRQTSKNCPFEFLQRSGVQPSERLVAAPKPQGGPIKGLLNARTSQQYGTMMFKEVPIKSLLNARTSQQYGTMMFKGVPIKSLLRSYITAIRYDDV